MTEFPLLKNAPITEALIDLRIKLKENFDIERFNLLYEKISDQYPTQKKRHKWEGRFEFKKGEGPTSIGTEKVDGIIFTSADGKKVFQARVDGFTFNRLKPYEKWETLRDEAFRLWKLYREITSPEISRVALRFINQFEIPLFPEPLKDFNEYLTAPPTVPAGLPQGVTSFFTRIVIQEPAMQAFVIITQVFEQIVTPNKIPIILDIDVFKENSDGLTEEQAWEVLEKMRHFKNKIFFESITEKTKELFA